MKRILLAYGVSGFISLAYQVAWFRVVTDWFGSTNLTFALVVANFIGGLALGSLCSRGVGERLARVGLRELQRYGAVELLVAATVGLTFAGGALPADLLGSFPYQEADGVFVPSLAYRTLQAVTASACVLVPCFFMGVTFPLLCDHFAGRPGGARFPARLYAVNTLGACSGVVACQYLLLPELGHDRTLLAMAVANAALGGIFLLPAAGAGAGSEDAPTATTAAAPPGAQRAPASLLALVTLGGFLAGALEGDLFKRVTFVIELNPGATMSFISFWAILGIFLASAAVHRLPRLSLGAVRGAFVLAALYTLFVWPEIDALRDWVERSVTPSAVTVGANLEGMRNLDFPATLTQLLCFTGLVVLPPYFLVSLLLPWACNRLQGERTHLGLAYGLNTAAFCVGLLAFVLVVPFVNHFYASKLFVALFAVSVGWLFLLRPEAPLGRWRPAAWATAVATVALLVPARFDPGFFRAGSLPATHPVRAVKSNGAHTTFVVDVGGRPRLFFGRLLMSATNLPAQTYMRLMAHFPLLLHPDPKQALLICLGVGNTGSAIARHPRIEAIDVVDLNRRVIETAPEFAAFHRDFHRDARVRFVQDDGRNFLRLSDRRYDLITSEPPPPLAAGVYRLYSEEYYREVLAHLTPDGFMTQWLPLFLMTPEAVEMSIRTFLEVFPHTFLFTGFGTDFILLGSPAPIDLARLEERLAASPTVRGELARLGVREPVDLLARIVQDDASLRRNYGDAPLISDQRNDLEHMTLRADARPLVQYEVEQVVPALGAAVPSLRDRLLGVMTHLGRLRYHVQGYPFETLAAVPTDTHPPVALAGIDWAELGRLYLANAAALRRGGAPASIEVLERFLEVSPEQPEVLLVLARLKRQVGRPAEARAHLEAFLAIEPGDPLGLHLLRELEAASPAP
ncbi:MAG: tetratricopeptide repeat protein [Myxococcota bacterium]